MGGESGMMGEMLTSFTATNRAKPRGKDQRSRYNISWHFLLAAGCSALSSVLGCSSHHQRHALSTDHLEVDPNLPEQLCETVRFLSHEIGERNCYRPDNLSRAAGWIEKQLISDGYVVRSESFQIIGKRFQCADQSVRNIVTEVRGTQHPEQIIVVGAHYDSRVAMEAWHDHNTMIPDQRGTPGANDNGSGVAAGMALAKQFAQQPQARTIRFCLWVNEEPPFYHQIDSDVMGSYVSAKRSRQAGEDLRGVLAFDTVGCYSPQPNRKRNGVLDFAASTVGLPRTTDYVAFLATHPNEQIVESSATVYAQHSRVPVRSVVLPYVSPLVAWSDDWSYSRMNYPAFCITDTAFLRSDRYHEMADTIDGMDFEPFADVVWGVHYVVRDLANSNLP